MAIPSALHPQCPILIVDDEENALTSMSITLRSAGFNSLRTCAESRNVVAMLAREKFSLVILDLNMPHVTGHDIIRQSAGFENRPPLIVVTASSQIRDYAEGTAGGVIDYLVKPIDRDRLLAVVQKALAGPRGSSKGRLTRNYLLSNQITAGSRVTGFSEPAGVMDMLEQARTEYRRLIDGLPTPYVLLDEDTFRIRYSNNAFLRFMGADLSAVPERMCFFGLLDDKERERTVRRLREQGELRDEELRGRIPGGRSFVIVGSFRLCATDGFAEGGFVDVTGPRQMEQELARTHRLDTVGRLAAGLAHDFNNTLSVVTGYAELISSEEGVTQQVRAHAQEIHLASAKASRMIRQLLTMGRAPQKARACIELNAVLREAEASLRQHLRDGQTLVISPGPESLLVDVSASQMDQVVRNLVLNARDAVPAGGAITITTRTGDDPSFLHGGGQVFLEIRDSGTGMDAETLARIFEPFFTTKTAGEGTGLGLPMVQMIIEAAGGRIHVESSPGSGTLFRIVLPSAAASDASGRQRLPQSIFQQEAHHEMGTSKSGHTKGE
jgi:signal transduction histidine kinase